MRATRRACLRPKVATPCSPSSSTSVGPRHIGCCATAPTSSGRPPVARLPASARAKTATSRMAYRAMRSTSRSRAPAATSRRWRCTPARAWGRSMPLSRRRRSSSALLPRCERRRACRRRPDATGRRGRSLGRGRQRAARVHSIASMASPSSLDFYHAELRAHHEHLRGAYGIGRGHEVLDIGCGTGLTAREAARAAAPGGVVGVDVSERMLERARELTAAEGLDNVRYELGDAQLHRFDPDGFDVAISRFGTMFFSDPAAAFANIAGALRPEARLVLLVWQRLEHNDWVRAIDAALGAAQSPLPRAGPFSLGDAQAPARILERAGFDEISFEDVHEPVLYGHELDAALAIVRRFQSTSAALASLNEREAASAVERLRGMLAAHHSDEHGVALDSRSWLITARRRRHDA